MNLIKNYHYPKFRPGGDKKDSSTEIKKWKNTKNQKSVIYINKKDIMYKYIVNFEIPSILIVTLQTEHLA